jgi:ABC-2 type transport system ATP-binding protein
MSNPVAIQTEGISKPYGQLRALPSLTLEVTYQSIFGFLGPNGAGKMTAIKLLLGLAGPTSGTASVFGLDIGRDSAEIREREGYLAQAPLCHGHMTAREMLHFTARFFYAGPNSAIEDRIQETPELVGFDEMAYRPIEGFSGRESQRLGNARGQINYPDLLILDEPAASLDPQGRHDVLDVMERLRKHTTIFYSTHILDDVQRVSDTAASLNQGQVVAQAPIEELQAGNGEVVYTPTLQGDDAAAQGGLVAQPWVRSITADHDHGAKVLKVTATDEPRASAHLLSVVLGDPSEVGAADFDVVESGLEQGLAMNVTLSFEHDMIGFARKTFRQRKETMT